MANDFTDFPVFTLDVDDWTPPNCRYADVENITDAVYITSFGILMINIRSCKKNFNSFMAHFNNILAFFSCIIFTETWLTSDLDNIYHIPGFYSCNLYRDHYGGGIKLYIRNGIKSRLLKDYTFINDLFEMLSVELLFGDRKAILTAIYHPPTPFIARNYAFIDSLVSYIRYFMQLNIPVIVAGDFNVNLLNPNNFVYVDSFIMNMLELGLWPIINIPTKYNLGNCITRFSLIDQIWVSKCIVNQQSFVLPLDITDHFPVIAILKLPFNIVYDIQNYICRPFLEQGKQTFNLLISNFDIYEIVGDYNNVYNQFFTNIFKCYEVAFPTVQCKKKPGEMTSWMTPALKLCIKKKSRLYKQFLKGKISRHDYNFFKNRLTNIVRRTKRLYFTKLLLDASKDSKTFWNSFNNLIQRCPCQSLKEIRVGNAILVGQELVNYVNNFFTTAVSSITRHLPPPSDYIFITPPVQNSCFFNPSSPSEEIRVIKGLKNKGSKLFDIHPTIIKENLLFFGRHLSHLYNMSLTESVFPCISKIGRVTPTHKSGPEDAIDNYRPISSLPVFSKIFEKLTYTRMDNFISRYNILSPCQYGFRSGKSTTQAITRLLTYVVNAFHEKIYCACFYLDLRKAFDTIDHSILLKKLNHYGFRGQCYEYLKSYYENRKQYVYLNGYKSEVSNIVNGVPQGSVLGPLCFNLHINDLPSAVDAYTVLFADDAAFIITACTIDELYNKINNLFSDLTIYLNMNRLVPNSRKSKLMMFSSQPTKNLPDLLFANEIIEWVNEFKYLGLTITNRLSFSNHINRVALNISRITGIFVNIRTIVPYQLMMKLYYALVFPHLINHVIIWGSAPNCHLKVLSTRLNNLLRVILGVKWVNYRPVISTQDMYNQNKVLKLESIFKYCLYKFLRQLVDGHLPEFYNSLLEPHTSLHAYGTRGRRFRHPALVSEVERKFLPHQLILLYDSLPDEIFNVNLTVSLETFKTLLLSNQ